MAITRRYARKNVGGDRAPYLGRWVGWLLPSKICGMLYRAGFPLISGQEHEIGPIQPRRSSTLAKVIQVIGSGQGHLALDSSQGQGDAAVSQTNHQWLKTNYNQ